MLSSGTFSYVFLDDASEPQRVVMCTPRLMGASVPLCTPLVDLGRSSSWMWSRPRDSHMAGQAGVPRSLTVAAPECTPASRGCGPPALRRQEGPFCMQLLCFSLCTSTHFVRIVNVSSTRCLHAVCKREPFSGPFTLLKTTEEPESFPWCRLHLTVCVTG